MNQKKIEKIVIAGGGTAGWITAAVLANAFGRSMDIALVESDDIPTVGVGEATIPPLVMLHSILGLNESEFLAKTRGTFKLGIQFENWKTLGEHYIHSFGEAGKDNWTCKFIHFWLAGRKHGVAIDYGDYCFERRAARENKFSLGSGDRFNYAYHFDAGRYAALLREYSEKHGVYRIEGKIERVNLDSTNGNITSLSLASGDSVQGDLFIDCTGFKALLIGDALKTEYIDWSHWLPCDRAVAVQTEITSAPIPYTRSIAHQYGWQWRIPLQHRVGNGMVYCSQYQSDESALQLLLANIDAEPINQPRSFKFTTGTRARHWHKNCVAIGLSSGFLEPLESTSIHLIQKSAMRLAKMLPADAITGSEVEEFNRQTHMEMEDIRDFIVLHYHLNERSDSAFWEYCRNMEIPDSLERKMTLFSDSALIFKASHELFGEESWAQVMMGQGVMPRSYHRAADALSVDELKGFLMRTSDKIKMDVAKMPTHQDFINYYCKTKN